MGSYLPDYFFWATRWSLLQLPGRCSQPKTGGKFSIEYFANLAKAIQHETPEFREIYKAVTPKLRNSSLCPVLSCLSLTVPLAPEARPIKKRSGTRTQTRNPSDDLGRGRNTGPEPDPFTRPVPAGPVIWWRLRCSGVRLLSAARCEKGRHECLNSF